MGKVLKIIGSIMMVLTVITLIAGFSIANLAENGTIDLLWYQKREVFFMAIPWALLFIGGAIYQTGLEMD